MNPVWLEKYPRLSKTLLDYGWFVAPYMLGRDFERLEQLCGHIESAPPATDAGRKQVEELIDGLLGEIAFHPQFRAFFVFRSLQLQHVKEYSHLFESAVHSYYRREYLPATLTLLPAIEGVLLSYYGWQFGGQEEKPSPKQLIDRIRTTDFAALQAPMRDASVMFRDTLADFLQRWIYVRTDNADFSLSFLNRHFALHGLGPQPFYRPADVHRLLLLFDLIIEFLSMPRGPWFTFIPEDEPSLDFRRVFYDQLAKGQIGIEQSIEFSRALLNQHTNFQEPPTEPGWANSQLNSILETIEMMSKIARPKSPLGPPNG